MKRSLLAVASPPASRLGRLACVALLPVAVACGDDAGATDAIDTVDNDTSVTTESDTFQVTDTNEPPTDTTEPSIDTTEPPIDTTDPDIDETSAPPVDTVDTLDSFESDTAETTEPVDTVMPARCDIDGTTYERQQPNPGNVCERCDPGASDTAWTPTSGDVEILDGGVDHASQGWAITSLDPARAVIVDGSLELATTTAEGASTSGVLLLGRTLPLPAGSPFTFEVDLRLDAVSKHNLYDAATAILASHHSAFASPTDRGQMIYLDTDAIGWADDSDSVSLALADGAFHTIKVSVDGGVARVFVDDVERLSRTGFTSNGAIAIGDQTNDKDVDGTMRVRSVRLICP